MSTQENNPYIDNQVEVGMRVKLIAMHEDPDPIPPGTIGEVVSVTHWNETIIGVKWENGRTLNIITGVDEYELLTSREESDDTMDRLKNIGEGKESRAVRGVTSTFKSEFAKKGERGVKFESDDVKKVMPIKDIAKKHGVTTSVIKKEIEIGTKIELEHVKDPKQVSDKDMARKIATHHVEEHHDYYSNKEHGLVASEKDLEEDYGASAGVVVAPFGSVIKKESVYGESYTIKKSDLISEVSTTNTAKLRNGDGAFDGNAWVGDKKNDGWNFNDKPTFHEDGEIVDILAKLDIDWTDEDLTVMTKESITEGIKKLSEEKVLLDEGKIEEFRTKLKTNVKKNIDKNKKLIKKLYTNAKRAHNDIKSGEIKDNKESQQNLKNVIKDIARVGGHVPFFLIPGGGISLIAAKKLIPVVGNVLKLSVEEYREENNNREVTRTPEEDEDVTTETTTFAGVMDDNGKGMPVGKTFASKGADSTSGKKPSYEGGTIVQTIPNEGVLTNEVNDIKYVKGGKFVKFKNKCVKYRNQEFCSSGNMDNPLLLSDKTSDNIDEVSRKMGISKEQIFEMIIKNREKIS